MRLPGPHRAPRSWLSGALVAGRTVSQVLAPRLATWSPACPRTRLCLASGQCGAGVRGRSRYPGREGTLSLAPGTTTAPQRPPK